MTNKEKRRAVHDYQFVVYTPQEKRYRRGGDLVWEITGHVYPFREGIKFREEWLEAFIPPPNKHKRR